MARLGLVEDARAGAVTGSRPSQPLEQATGRPVTGFMSGNQHHQQHPDLVCEVFIPGPSDLVDGGERQPGGGASGGSSVPPIG